MDFFLFQKDHFGAICTDQSLWVFPLLAAIQIGYHCCSNLDSSCAKNTWTASESWLMISVGALWTALFHRSMYLTKLPLWALMILIENNLWLLRNAQSLVLTSLRFTKDMKNVRKTIQKKRTNEISSMSHTWLFRSCVPRGRRSWPTSRRRALSIRARATRARSTKSKQIQIVAAS